MRCAAVLRERRLPYHAKAIAAACRAAGRWPWRCICRQTLRWPLPVAAPLNVMPPLAAPPIVVPLGFGAVQRRLMLQPHRDFDTCRGQKERL
jgi:hypothetical protein